MSDHASKSIRVVGISGSLAADGATMRIVGLALEGAAADGIEIELLDLRGIDLPFCDGRDDYNSYPDTVQRFRRAVRSAQGVILASPEYHNSLSGVLKNALDLLTPDDLNGKMCGLIGVAGGSQGAINALNAMRIICRGFGAWVVPHQVSISQSSTLFAEDGTVRDTALLHRIRHLGVTVAANARLHSPILSH